MEPKVLFENLPQLTCQRSFEGFHESLYNMWLNKKEAPLANQKMVQKLKEWTEEHFNDWNEQAQWEFNDLIMKYYDWLTHIAPQKNDSLTERQKITLLAAFEVGDQSSPEQRELLRETKEYQAKILDFIKTHESSNCQNLQNITSSQVALPSSPSSPESSSSSLDKMLFGGRKALTVAYQSCSPLVKPPLDSSTPNLEGVKIVGTHKDGIGSLRAYGDVNKILHTHYYYYDQPKSLPNSCKDSRAKPLIYDYGGRPYSTANIDATMNLFKNDGDGTSILGIDCSGLIGTIVARAGLRLAPGKTFKAIHVQALSSYMFHDPKNNGLSCFDVQTINANNRLKAGDVIAVPGHVVLVDSVGADPFGVRDISSLNDCRLEKMDPTKFDFVVIQSSPYKNAIGISKSLARDYIPTSEKLTEGLKVHALNACRAQFKVGPVTKDPLAHIIRHKESGSCLAPKPIYFDYEACVADCDPLI